MNSNKLTIGLLAGSLQGAGAEKTILTLADFLVRDGCDVNLFLLGEGADYKVRDGITIIRLDGKHRKDKQEQLATLTNQTHYDLFITSRPDYYSFITADHKFISVHITPYSWLMNEKKSLLSRYLKLLRIRKKYKNRKLIALSQGIKDELISHLGCHSSSITVINNPFDIERIHNEADKTGPLPEKDYIIYVAALIPRKRHSDLLKAFKKLDSSLDLVLVGKGPCEQELKLLAKQLNISDRVIFWGWDKNPYRLIRQAKLSVLTSEAEGLPRTLIESLLIGTRTVSTDCPSGPNEVLIGPFSRYLIPVGDVEKLSQVMQSALIEYPDIKQLNLDRFSGENVANRFLDLIQK
jgi:glycosyltransferase involved in cell wall biosynthesis